MIRRCLPFLGFALLAGCQPAPAEKHVEVSSSDGLVGTWVVNSNGYKNGVYQEAKKIITTCTEYKADGTYNTVQQVVGPTLNFVDTEIGKWTFNGSFLAMTPTTKNREFLAGTTKDRPKVTGETFQIEIIKLTPSTMRRRAGTDYFDFVASSPPRRYTSADLKPDKKSSA
jgi:hypothetical protein